MTTYHFKPGDIFKTKGLFYFRVVSQEDLVHWQGMGDAQARYYFSRPSLQDCVCVQALGLNWGPNYQVHSQDDLRKEKVQRVDTSKPYDVNEYHNLDTSMCPHCSKKYR